MFWRTACRLLGEDKIMPLADQHWIIKNFKQRCLKKEAQEILMEHESINFKGHPCFLKCKNLGAGVYEIYKDMERYNDKIY